MSTYKGKFGYVHYYVKALMERPQQPILECKKAFEVEEPLDVNTPDLLVSLLTLNKRTDYMGIFYFSQLKYDISGCFDSYPSASPQTPTGGMKEKKVTCMFIPDGQVSLNAKIDRRRFCEGEDICINAKFENTCSRIVVPKAAIIAKHTYQANGRTKIFRQKLSSVRGNHIISGMCDAWQGKTIRVPKIKPSMLGCNIIRVEYALMVSLMCCSHGATDFWLFLRIECSWYVHGSPARFTFTFLEVRSLSWSCLWLLGLLAWAAVATA